MFYKVGRILSTEKCTVRNPQDGDGTVSTKELGAVLRSLGFLNLRSQLEEYKYDMNHNDIIHQEAIRHKKSWMI